MVKNFPDMNEFDNTKQVRYGILLLNVYHLTKPSQDND